MSRRAKATVVGVIVGVVFFPIGGTVACPSSLECRQSVSTFWGLEMAGAVGAIAPLLAAGLAGWLTYLWLGRRQA